MATLAKAALVVFKVGAGGSPENFTALGEILGIPDLSMEMGEADATNMGSPNIGGSIMEEAIATKIVRTPEISIPMNAVLGAAEQIALISTKFLAGTVSNYRIEFPGHARMLTFAAWVKRVSLANEIDSKSDLEITFRPTGGYNWAAIV